MARILFYWADQALAEGVCDLLLIEGHHCTLTNDPDTALMALRRGGVDLLIENLWWPGTDGWQLYHKVLNDAMLRRVSILVISAMPPVEAVRQGMQLTDLAGYLMCPFEVDDLLATIDAAVPGQPQANTA
jgi:DNA-binding response OmpR family regulator